MNSLLKRKFIIVGILIFILSPTLLFALDDLLDAPERGENGVWLLTLSGY